MTESRNPDQASSDCLKAQEDLMQLCSAQLDGNLSAAEEAKWSEMIGGIRPGDIVENFSRDSRRLGEILRSLPVQSAGSQILEAIAAERRSEQAQRLQPKPRTKNIVVRRWLLGASGVLTAAVMLILFRNQQFSEFDAIATSDSAVRISGNQDSKPEPSAMAFPETEVLSGGDDWQILSLRISVSDREEALSQVRLLASSVGLKMQPMSDSASKSDLDGFGILLTSAPAERQAFIDRVTDSELVRSSEWEPLQIAQMDRRALISAVRESMLSPTQSELHFGEVFIAVHSTDPADEPLVTDRGAADSSVRESRAADAAFSLGVADSDLSSVAPESTETQAEITTSRAAVSSRFNPALRNRPVLVMFELEQIPSARSSGL